MTAPEIPYGRHDIHPDDEQAVLAALRSGWLTQGPAVPRFEAAVAEYCGVNRAVAVNSATSALHVACLALGLGPGDWLWTSPNTFVASANCGRACGAQVDFVDIDPRTLNMNAAALAAKLQRAAEEGRVPKVLVPVHFAGQSCDMAAIRYATAPYGVRVLEDASHAIGGRYRGAPVGNCRYSDIAVFSFHPVKIITSGEGGIAVTNDPVLADRMKRLRNHGITRETGLMAHGSAGGWYYEQLELGFNYRMNDLEAALGASQLRRLDTYVARRRDLAARYDRLLAGLPLTTPWSSPDVASATHLYVVRVLPPRDRKVVFERLRACGIGVSVHYIPVHTQPYYRALGFAPGNFPEAERYYASALSLPMYATMREEDQDRVVAVLQETFA